MIRPEADSGSFDLTAALTVFDLEYTAWEGSLARAWLEPGQFREVVQIGAVKLDADSFAVMDEFDLLVRPRVNPRLSGYFEQLTGITNQAVARHGLDFADAYERFLDFAGADPIAAFGRDDLVLMENLRLYGLKRARPLPLFYDLRGWFAVQGLDPRGRLAWEIAPALGLEVGRKHNALDDARSLAAGMAALAGRTVRPAA
jgi:inhibitor of KinA sporulation pathway (predicted exonuclease)